MTKKTKRYKIDSEIVSQTIKDKIQKYKERIICLKTELIEDIDKLDKIDSNYLENKTKLEKYKKSTISIFNKFIKDEKNYYSLVRIAEDLTSKSKKRFHLVYGKEKDSQLGTDPLASRELAQKWFTNQGR